MLVFVWYALLYVHSSCAIILTRKRELVGWSAVCDCGFPDHNHLFLYTSSVYIQGTLNFSSSFFQRSYRTLPNSLKYAETESWPQRPPASNVSEHMEHA